MFGNLYWNRDLSTRREIDWVAPVNEVCFTIEEFEQSKIPLQTIL